MVLVQTQMPTGRATYVLKSIGYKDKHKYLAKFYNNIFYWK